MKKKTDTPVARDIRRPGTPSPTTMIISFGINVNSGVALREASLAVTHIYISQVVLRQ